MKKDVNPEICNHEMVRHTDDMVICKRCGYLEKVNMMDKRVMVEMIRDAQPDPTKPMTITEVFVRYPVSNSLSPDFKE